MRSNPQHNLIIFSAIALITISFALISKGNALERKRITSCFSRITVTNGIDSLKMEYTSCANVLAAMGKGIYYIKDASNKVDPDACQRGTQLFYCATIAEVVDSLAPLIDLGDGFKRYGVETVFCSYVPE